MTRSSSSERVQRINAALRLIKIHGASSEAATALVRQYTISKRQAYRYLQEATVIGQEVPIPEQKVAFTVKLPLTLIQRLRGHAKSTGQNLSEIVMQALEVFLCKGRRRG